MGSAAAGGILHQGGLTGRMAMSRDRADGRNASSSQMVGSGGNDGGQAPSSKRPRISGGGAGGGITGVGGGAGAGAGGSGSTGNGPAGSASVVGNGGGPGAGGVGGGGNVERSPPPGQMDEAPPPIPPLNTGVSQMIVTRPGGTAAGGGGDGAQRRFYNPQLQSFSDGGNQGPGGSGQAPGLTRGPSLPAGVTDPTEV